MELGEKVVGTKAGHNALAKGTPLKKGISFSMGMFPARSCRQPSAVQGKVRPGLGLFYGRLGRTDRIL